MFPLLCPPSFSVLPFLYPSFSLCSLSSVCFSPCSATWWINPTPRCTGGGALSSSMTSVGSTFKGNTVQNSGNDGILTAALQVQSAHLQFPAVLSVFLTAFILFFFFLRIQELEEPVPANVGGGGAAVFSLAYFLGTTFDGNVVKSCGNGSPVSLAVGNAVRCSGRLFVGWRPYQCCSFCPLTHTRIRTHTRARVKRSSFVSFFSIVLRMDTGQGSSPHCVLSPLFLLICIFWEGVASEK